MKNHKLMWKYFLIAICFIGVCISIFVVNRDREAGVESMTEEELINIVLSDEHFVDLFLCTDDNRAVQGLSKRSEALGELLTRGNAEQALLAAIQIRDPVNAKVEIERDGLEKILDYVITQKGTQK